MENAELIEEIAVEDVPETGASDADYVWALHKAGVLGDMSDALVRVLRDDIPPGLDEDARRIDLLLAYYEAGGDHIVSDRRKATDRMALISSSFRYTAADVVRVLSDWIAGLPPVSLERIGGSDGPLVLRASEHLSAISDPDEDDHLEHSSVTVRSVVGAFNVLLDRFGVRERFVPLPSDGDREMYVMIGLSSAMTLCQQGGLEETSPERLMIFAAW